MGALVIAHGQPSAAVFSRRRLQGGATASSSCPRPRLRPRLWLNPHFAPPQVFASLRLLPLVNDAVILFSAFSLRCSLINTDAWNSVANDEFHEDTTSVNSNCSVPVVHLISDPLEKEEFNLLGGTYADTTLTALPVLPEEDLSSIAATPAHPAGLFSFYASCLAGNLVEQIWSFAWPAAIALIHPSLLPVAVIGFFVKLAVIVGGPLVGQLMDHFPRIPAYNSLTGVQVAAQLVSVGMIIHAYNVHLSSVSSILAQPWFVVLVIALAVERLSGLALGVAMERDWVILLAGTNRPIALAQANAVLSRIDLLCEIAGASLFGIFLSKYEPAKCLKMAACLMVWSLPVVVVLTWLTNKLSSGVLEPAKCPETGLGFSSVESNPDTENIFAMSIEAIKHGWFEYIQQPVLPASLAYVLLYFNILAPGSLMTAFLTQQGINPSIIGGFSGSCAFMGVAATFLSAKLVERLGILKAGAAGLIFQAAVLTMAVAVYSIGSYSQKIPLVFFLSLIVLSRLGHMSYDVVGAQIFQMGIPASKANLIGTTEVSIASLAESVMLGVVIIANDVSHFGFLAMLSLLSVFGAACLFCRWVENPTDLQKSLFFGSALLRMCKGLMRQAD